MDGWLWPIFIAVLLAIAIVSVSYLLVYALIISLGLIICCCCCCMFCCCIKAIVEKTYSFSSIGCTDNKIVICHNYIFHKFYQFSFALRIRIHPRNSIEAFAIRCMFVHNHLGCRVGQSRCYALQVKLFEKWIGHGVLGAVGLLLDRLVLRIVIRLLRLRLRLIRILLWIT